MGEGTRDSATIRLREYREDRGLTQFAAAAAIQRFARARGDAVVPGLDQTALCRHENGHRRPSLYYETLYSQFYGATPAELGFRVALSSETRDHDDVDRREFLTGAAGFAASVALPDLPAAPTRLGEADLVRLKESVVALYKLDDQHGAGAVYRLTVRNFHRLRGLSERARYGPTTGRGLHELAGQSAWHAGWLAHDAGQHDDARHWWLEAMHWGQIADAEPVSVSTMASMAMQASAQRRPREAINLAAAAQRAARGTATPRLKSVLLAREALGHAGVGDAPCARTALSRARELADQTRHDDDPDWLAFYGPADFAAHERRVALMLGDTAAAEEAARAGLALGDPVDYPRNHALYLLALADVLAQRRKIDESAAVASRAAAAAADLDSGRVTRGLHAVARRLAPFSDDPGVGAHLDAVRAALPSSMLA